MLRPPKKRAMRMSARNWSKGDNGLVDIMTLCCHTVFTQAIMNDWGVVHRVLHEDGEDRFLQLRITGVPEGIERGKIKRALELAGRVYGEGSRPWGNYQILPREDWIERDKDPSEAIPYSELMDEAKGEKRVTLRIPIGLHTALVRAAQGKSFNQFCIDALGAAIAYQEPSLEDAVPGLAALQGVSEAEMRSKINRMAAASRATPTAQKKRFAEHLKNIVTASPESLKARSDAIYNDPEVRSAMDMMPGLLEAMPDSDFAAAAEAHGITVAELRAKLADIHAHMQEHIADWQSRTPEQTKETMLLIRDVMAGKGVTPSQE